VSQASPGANSRGRLLVVDDDLLQRTIIGKIGSKLGFETVVVPSFEEAAGHLQSRSFDAMTLDLSLGEHDGVELLRLIADHGLNAMPIVIISGCEERVLNSTRRGLEVEQSGAVIGAVEGIGPRSDRSERRRPWWLDQARSRRELRSSRCASWASAWSARRILKDAYFRPSHVRGGGLSGQQFAQRKTKQP